MSRSLSRRIAAIEAERNPPPPSPPHILEINTFIGETREEALARFVKRWGPVPRGHRFLVVPKHAQTEEEEEIFKRTFFERQNRLYAEVKRRPIGLAQETPALPLLRPAAPKPKKQTLAMRSAVAEAQA